MSYESSAIEDVVFPVARGSKLATPSSPDPTGKRESNARLKHKIRGAQDVVESRELRVTSCELLQGFALIDFSKLETRNSKLNTAT